MYAATKAREVKSVKMVSWMTMPDSATVSAYRGDGVTVLWGIVDTEWQNRLEASIYRDIKRLGLFFSASPCTAAPETYVRMRGSVNMPCVTLKMPPALTPAPPKFKAEVTSLRGRWRTG